VTCITFQPLPRASLGPEDPGPLCGGPTAVPQAPMDTRGTAGRERGEGAQDGNTCHLRTPTPRPYRSDQDDQRVAEAGTHRGGQLTIRGVRCGTSRAAPGRCLGHARHLTTTARHVTKNATAAGTSPSNRRTTTSRASTSHRARSAWSLAVPPTAGSGTAAAASAVAGSTQRSSAAFVQTGAGCPGRWSWWRVGVSIRRQAVVPSRLVATAHRGARRGRGSAGPIRAGGRGRRVRPVRPRSASHRCR